MVLKYGESGEYLCITGRIKPVLFIAIEQGRKDDSNIVKNLMDIFVLIEYSFDHCL